MTSMPAIQDVSAPAREALRVLSVEDNPGDAILVREMLRDASHDGFVLQNADRLSAAVECLLDGAVDCVLLDLSLPDA
jgi:CheY-like chemotaxis protein